MVLHLSSVSLLVMAIMALNKSFASAALPDFHCAADYLDITRVPLRFQRGEVATSRKAPYLRGSQMKCIGHECGQPLRGAICFAKPLSDLMAWMYECEPIGLADDLMLSYFGLDCEEQRSPALYSKACAFKGSCIMQYELVRKPASVRRDLILGCLAALLSMAAVFFLVRFLYSLGATYCAGAGSGSGGHYKREKAQQRSQPNSNVSSNNLLHTVTISRADLLQLQRQSLLHQPARCHHHCACAVECGLAPPQYMPQPQQASSSTATSSNLHQAHQN